MNEELAWQLLVTWSLSTGTLKTNVETAFVFVGAELWVGWIGVVTALRDERRQNRSSIPGRGEIITVCTACRQERKWRYSVCSGGIHT